LRLRHAQGAIQTDVVSLKINASVSTRHGDWVMRMRFRGKSTRETQASARPRLPARAFHPEARSHDPITAPSRSGVKPLAPIHWLGWVACSDRVVHEPPCQPTCKASNQSGDALCEGQEEVAQRPGDT